MPGVIAPVAALLLSCAFLLTGNGLQGTLLAVRGDMEAFSTVSIGLLGSWYFLGFAAGCALGPYLLRRVGHIRAFAAMTAIASAVPLMHGLWVHPFPWWIMRLVTGFCFAVLYIVIESWLNERSTNETRGSILSIYVIINLTVLTAGQMMLTLDDPAGFALFAMASILVSVAAVPVALTASAAPAPIHSVKIRLRRLFGLSPVAFVGCLAVGMANGAFWSLGPVFAQRSGMGVTGIALFMSANILGGALGQWPIGRLSDRFDRRWVLTGACVMAAAAGLTIWLLDFFNIYRPWLVLVLAGLWGAFAFPLYAVAIAHANDHAADNEFVEVSSGMLLIFAAGSVVGPLIASAAVGGFGASSLYAYTALVHLLLGGYALWRMRQRAAPPQEECRDFSDSLTAAHTVSETFDNEIQQTLLDKPSHTAVVDAADEKTGAGKSPAAGD